MAEQRGFIPTKDAEFDEFFNHYYQYVNEKCTGQSPEWTHIPEARRTELTNAYIDWIQAYSKTKLAHTSSDILAKNLARTQGEKILRVFNNEFILYSSAVSPQEKLDLGNRPRDTQYTPVVPPEKGPAFAITQGGPRTLKIIYRDGDEGRKGSKPDGVQGARIYYGVFDTAPVEQDELPASVWATRCPHTVMFRETDRGRRAYFALKWEIRKEHGESGWSEFGSEIIP